MATAPLITLDRIVSVEPGSSARALRNVPMTLAILDSHFPRFPVLPGVLILGSMGQLAGVLLAEETGFPWRLAGARQVRYRHFVGPGDQMDITVELTKRDDSEALLKATVTVDGRAVTTARALRMVPAKTVDDAGPATDWDNG
jgi:3-hydroxyacyl-[acyl-carrier-protein] dehydratase